MQHGFFCAGIEVRDSGFVAVSESEISNSGSQGLVGHAGALGYALYRFSTVKFCSNIMTKMQC